MSTSNAARALVPSQLPRRESASPIVKWVGGKSRLLAQLDPLLPPGVELMRHVEPFFGGGAMFFSRAPERALLSDVNATLVHTYKMVRDDVESVIRELSVLSSRHSPDHYYAVRTRYNERRNADAEQAAQFIYLNKTCFNGLHRVNRRGEFNVPAGRYKNPRICDGSALRRASDLFAGKEIVHAPFEATLERVKPGDFVYFDPPYVPLSATSSFTSYAEDGFGDVDQVRLRDVFRELDRRGAKLMLSNSDAPRVHDLYRGFRVDRVMAPRAINSDASARGLVSEVVVRNYG